MLWKPHTWLILLLVWMAVPLLGGDAIVSSHGGQCFAFGPAQNPEIAKGRLQLMLKDCSDLAAVYSITSVGDLSLKNGKCLVAGENSLRAGSLIYEGECGSAESQWTYREGKIVNRKNPSRVLSALWNASVMIAGEDGGDPSQVYRVGSIIELPATTIVENGRQLSPDAAVIRRGQRGPVVVGSAVDLGNSRSLAIYR